MNDLMSRVEGAFYNARDHVAVNTWAQPTLAAGLLPVVEDFHHRLDDENLSEIDENIEFEHQTTNEALEASLDEDIENHNWRHGSPYQGEDDHDDDINNNLYELLDNAVKDKGYIYETMDSMGWMGDAHSDQIIINVDWVGASGELDTLNDEHPFLPSGNRIIANLDDKYEHKAIAGGQIYNQSSILQGYSKLTARTKGIISIIPSLVSQLLSPRNLSTVSKWEETKSLLKEGLDAIEIEQTQMLSHEQDRDNDSVRVELSFALNFEPDEDITPDFYWPSCPSDENGESAYHLNMAMMRIKQSQRHKKLREIYENTVQPLAKIVGPDSHSSVINMSPEIKTALVFLAEKITMITMNSFSVGIIHNGIKESLNKCSEWTVPYHMRVHLSALERSTTGLEWGVHPRLYPTVKDFESNAPEIIRSIEYSRRSILNMKKHINFPQVYVDNSRFLWHALQKYSLNVEQEPHLRNVGIFEEPKWTVLACLPIEDISNLMVDLARIVIQSYDQNWLLLLNRQKKKYHPQSLPHIAPPKFVDQCKNMDPVTFLAGYSTIPTKWLKYVSRDDELHVTTVGKCHSIHMMMFMIILSIRFGNKMLFKSYYREFDRNRKNTHTI